MTGEFRDQDDGLADDRPGALKGPESEQPLARVRVGTQSGVHIVAISGEVDFSNADEIARILSATPNSASGLVVDLRKLEYLDSAGISLLHDLASRLHQREQRLVIVAAHGSPPRALMDLTGMGIRAELVQDLAPAVGALQQ